MSARAGRQPESRAFAPRACLLALLVFFALLYLGLRAAGAYLIIGDPLKKADVVVPLGGGGDWRVQEAARLIGEKTAVAMLLTEPGEIDPGSGNASQHFRQVAIDAGISPNAIQITEGVQRTTHDEAEAVLATMQKHDYKVAIIVTDPFHTQRARMIFREVFDESGRSVRIHPVPNHWYRSATWFLRREGWGATIREYGKIIGFQLGLTGSLD